ncbi:hypothetical protein M407DRAFT_245416 [Tulasnella calospora MUT 4182]|uniref:Uncharacterized protein n=1 Tax=Tulasnella calospora MUT 4182 TaxID=1051891 RepID=A0A0C3QBB9_9AGAM|nr:hypothetical protein M407DRAFT_245416 [Tulasnella calospora MUT 4182]
MKDAIEEALKAFERLDKGYQYNKDDPHDPLRQAEDRIKQFVPRTEWTPPTNDDDQNKLATAISMIRVRLCTISFYVSLTTDRTGNR